MHVPSIECRFQIAVTKPSHDDDDGYVTSRPASAG